MTQTSQIDQAKDAGFAVDLYATLAKLPSSTPEEKAAAVTALAKALGFYCQQHGLYFLSLLEEGQSAWLRQVMREGMGEDGLSIPASAANENPSSLDWYVSHGQPSGSKRFPFKSLVTFQNETVAEVRYSSGTEGRVRSAFLIANFAARPDIPLTS